MSRPNEHPYKAAPGYGHGGELCTHVMCMCVSMCMHVHACTSFSMSMCVYMCVSIFVTTTGNDFVIASPLCIKNANYWAGG